MISAWGLCPGRPTQHACTQFQDALRHVNIIAQVVSGVLAVVIMIAGLPSGVCTSDKDCFPSNTTECNLKNSTRVCRCSGGFDSCQPPPATGQCQAKPPPMQQLSRQVPGVNFSGIECGLEAYSGFARSKTVQLLSVSCHLMVPF